MRHFLQFLVVQPLAIFLIGRALDINADDFTDQTVITYPVPVERLDLFNKLLMPQGNKPKTIRQIELTSVILPLVGANKGVSVLPDWVLQNARDTELLAQKS